MTSLRWPIGVFSSIDAGLGVQPDVLRELQIPTVQLHAPCRASRTAAQAKSFLRILDQMGVRLTCVFGGFPGESYVDIPTVAQTVGLVPRATRSARLLEMKEIAAFARQLECSVVALHLGFVPHDVRSPEYREVVAAAQELCLYCRELGQDLHLETGQETASALLQFIHDVGVANLFVNFDPANMVLYGTGQPIDALLQIGSLVHSVHCKDATWSNRPGIDWGSEVPLGAGDVGFERFLQALLQIGYDGPLTIEREIPQDPQRQKSEIAHAKNLLEDLRQTFGNGLPMKPRLLLAIAGSLLMAVYFVVLLGSGWGNAAESFFANACARAGLVTLAAAFAWPQLAPLWRKYPAWFWATLALALVIVLIRPRLFLLAIALVVAMVAIQGGIRWFSKNFFPKS